MVLVTGPNVGCNTLHMMVHRMIVPVICENIIFSLYRDLVTKAWD